MSLVLLLTLCAAAWTASAGIIHFIASTLPDHHAHPLLLAFFVGSGVLQVAWALLAVWRPSPRLLLVGATGNLLVAGVWVVSRTIGIPFVNAGAPETVGFGDVASTLFEVGAGACVALAVVLPPEAAHAMVRRGRGLLTTVSIATLALLLPSVVTLPAMDAGSQPSMSAMVQRHPGSPTSRVAGSMTMPSTGEHQEATGSASSMPAMAASTRSSLGRPMAMPMTVVSTQPDSHTMPGMQMGTSGSADALTGTQQGPQAMTFWGQRVVVRYGPISLPPNSLGGGLHNVIAPALQGPCVNCFITGVIPDMVYADGSQANIDQGVMLHHIVLFDNAHSDYTCSRNEGVGALGRRIFASGNERTAVSTPGGFGFQVGAGNWATLLMDLMNMTSQAKTVFLQFAVYYVPDSTPGIKTLLPVWLDENDCNNSEFSVPAGRSDTTWRWTSTLTGRVILAGGHVHDGGVSVALTDPTEGEHLCTSVAGYGTRPHYDGHVDSMSLCRWDRLGVVKAGDTLQLDTIYDTPTPARGCMGIMVMAVYPTSDLAGGTPPPPSATGPADGPESSPPQMQMSGMPGMGSCMS